MSEVITPISEAERLIIQTLHSNAEENASNTNGTIVVPKLDIDTLPDRYRINKGGVEARSKARLRELGFVTLDVFSSGLVPQFNSFNTNALVHPTTAITEIGSILKSNRSVSVAYGHDDYRDLALNLAFLSARLTEMEIPHRTAMIAAKGLDYAEIDPSRIDIARSEIDELFDTLGITFNDEGRLPMREFFGLFADETYFAVPDTPSFRHLRRDPLGSALIEKFSHSLMWKLGHSRRDKTQPPLLMGVAAPGATTKILDRQAGFEPSGHSYYPQDFEFDRHPIDVMSAPQTSIMTMLGNTAVFCGATRLRPDEPLSMHITDEGRQYSKGDFDQFLKDFYATQARVHPDTVLDQDGTMPVRRRESTAAALPE